MSKPIEDEETLRLIHLLVERTGVSLEQAVRTAVRERLEQLDAGGSGTPAQGSTRE